MDKYTLVDVEALTAEIYDLPVMVFEKDFSREMIHRISSTYGLFGIPLHPVSTHSCGSHLCRLDGTIVWDLEFPEKSTVDKIYSGRLKRSDIVDILKENDKAVESMNTVLDILKSFSFEHDDRFNALSVHGGYYTGFGYALAQFENDCPERIWLVMAEAFSSILDPIRRKVIWPENIQELCPIRSLPAILAEPMIDELAQLQLSILGVDNFEEMKDFLCTAATAPDLPYDVYQIELGNQTILRLSPMDPIRARRSCEFSIDVSVVKIPESEEVVDVTETFTHHCGETNNLSWFAVNEKVLDNFTTESSWFPAVDEQTVTWNTLWCDAKDLFVEPANEEEPSYLTSTLPVGENVLPVSTVRMFLTDSELLANRYTGSTYWELRGHIEKMCPKADGCPPSYHPISILVKDEKLPNSTKSKYDYLESPDKMITAKGVFSIRIEPYYSDPSDS
jgi:hypothetical protein